MNILHLTSVHPRYDTRIFHKMCVSSQELGHSVSLVVADGQGNEEYLGVKIFDVGLPRNRLDRFFRISPKLMLFSRSIQSDLHHIHDPELMMYLTFLKTQSKIIFDFHEDVGSQILRKEYLSRAGKSLLSFCYKLFELIGMLKVDGVIAATDHISNLYRDKKPTQTVCNYPIHTEFENNFPITVSIGHKNLVYVGGLSKARGIGQLVDALDFLDDEVVLHLCGTFSSSEFESFLKSKSGWGKVQYHGFLNRQSVVRVLASANLGVVTLLPDPSYMVSLPVKMFEYFAAKLPVVASDFPLWSEILESNNCGSTVDPCDPVKIANVIDDLLSDPYKMRALGQNGYEASVKKFNWTIEHDKLEKFYSKVLGTF